MDDFEFSPIYDTDKEVIDKFGKNDDQYNASKYYQNGYGTLASQELGMCSNELMNLFFSDENIKRIQQKIKDEMYERSKHKIVLKDDQDVLDLTIAMRAVFELYAKNIPYNYVRQVKGLNKQTVEYVMPDMITNILQQEGYKKDISQPMQTLPLPENVRTAGRTTLPSVSTSW